VSLQRRQLKKELLPGAEEEWKRGTPDEKVKTGVETRLSKTNVFSLEETSES